MYLVKGENDLITVTLPFEAEFIRNFKDFSKEKQEEYVLDISKISYEDSTLNANKINCSFIYLRNVDINIACDFSKLSYTEKANWLKEYITANIFDLGIKELSETCLCVFAGEMLTDYDCILSQDELELFCSENIDLLTEVRQFIVSLEVLVHYMAANLTEEHPNFDIDMGIPDLKIIEGKPKYFETLHGIIQQYPIVVDSIRMVYSSSIPLVKYMYVLNNIEKSSLFYMDVLNLPTVKFFGLLLNDEVCNGDNAG